MADRFPLIIKKAIIKAGTFRGVEKAPVASALDIRDAELTAAEMSRAEPGAVFGVFAKETRGERNLSWWKKGGWC